MRGQGVPVALFDQRLAVLTAHVDLVRSLHRGLHPSINTYAIGSDSMRESDVADDVCDVKCSYLKNLGLSSLTH
jgi:hypothetical protein